MQNIDILALAGLRLDGRKYDDIRRIKLKVGVVDNADGSVYYEQGLNKVLILVLLFTFSRFVYSCNTFHILHFTGSYDSVTDVD